MSSILSLIKHPLFPSSNMKGTQETLDETEKQVALTLDFRLPVCLPVLTLWFESI